MSHTVDLDLEFKFNLKLFTKNLRLTLIIGKLQYVMKCLKG